MKLGKYKGLTGKLEKLEVKDIEIERVLTLKQKQNAVEIHMENGGRKTEYQEIDDDFAKDFSKYDTIAQWKESIRQRLQERRDEACYGRMVRQLMDQVILASDIEVDEDIVDDITDELFDDLMYELEMQGSSLEEYKKKTGQSMKQIMANRRKEAVRTYKEQWILHAIAEAEDIEITDEALSATLEHMAAEDGMDVEEYTDMLGDEEIEAIMDQLVMEEAYQVILQSANII